MLGLACDLDRSVVRSYAQRYDAQVMIDRYEQVMTSLADRRPARSR